MINLTLFDIHLPEKRVFFLENSDIFEDFRIPPMSDLYIVCTDNYAVEFWGPKHRALTIKLNYWFNL